MRRALHARVRPLVDRFQNKLLELAAARLDAEVARIDQALEVALSSYESDAAAPDLITAALGPDLAAMLDAPQRIEGRAPAGRRKAGSVKMPSTDGATVRASVVRGAVPQATDAAVPEPAVAAEQGSTSSPPLQANGKKPVTCSKCGHVGGNARGCGKPTGHPTTRTSVTVDFGRAPRDITPVPVAVPPPPVRALKPTTAAIEQHRSRLAVLRERSARQQAADKPIATAGQDDNPNAKEHWTKEECDEEAASAEARKLAGELPGPASTWTFG